jgi:hypothetical protein
MNVVATSLPPSSLRSASPVRRLWRSTPCLYGMRIKSFVALRAAWREGRHNVFDRSRRQHASIGWRTLDVKTEKIWMRGGREAHGVGDEEG